MKLHERKCVQLWPVPLLVPGFHPLVLLQPKYGFRYMKRDGMEEFLSNLAQQGYEVIFWTDTALAGGFEIFEKLLSV